MFGDQTVTMNCAALAFRVNAGVMQAENLVLDTSINTLVGSGQIDLAQERLELTLVPRTKVPSIVALRSPIHITGSLAQPRVELDRARLAARGLGAVVLGLVNPLLMLVPLVETGPGVQAGCAVRSDAPPAPPAR
jgi:AsmA protein